MLFTRNVELGPARRINAWRKVAIGTWRDPYDPTVYGYRDLDCTEAHKYMAKLSELSGERVTMTHYLGKVVAETVRRYPDINCVLRFGKIYPRKRLAIFFHVIADMDKGTDLTGTTVHDADKKSMLDFAREIGGKVDKIRSYEDKSYKKMKNLMDALPGFMAGFVLWFSNILLYKLNIWSPLLGSPRDSFGSIMMTNIGSLGLEGAWAPLVAYSSAPLVISMGAIKDRAVVIDGEIKVRSVMRFCGAFDHRVLDGVYASWMINECQKVFENPDAEIGSPEDVVAAER